MSPPLRDDEYRLLAEWLAHEYGLKYGPEKREILRARLEPIRAELGMASFERLLFYVRYHPDGQRERLSLLSRLTNNESYFFRERKQLDVLAEEVLPAMVREVRMAGRSTLRLLSAGCAAGEEAYTLAILGREAVRGGQLEIRVTGVDLDVRVLERAREGLYGKHAFRAMDAAVRDRYFGPEPGGWRLDEAIRATARFQQGNLVDASWPGTVPRHDVAFCRNVMIYFDEAGVRRVVDNLYRVLRPGGCLFLGHAESLSRVPTRFVPQRRPGAIYYRRPKERGGEEDPGAGGG